MNSNKNIETLSKLRNFICHYFDFSNALTAIDECMQMSYIVNGILKLTPFTLQMAK